MITKKTYAPEQWQKISELPVSFFENYVSLIKTPYQRKTMRDLHSVVISKMKVYASFNEKELYELFDGNVEGLIVSFIMQNQHLFVE
jgi:hypothetical protein